MAFFGDGATNQAYFHECLNFAAVLSLPVVFVCENNFYGEFTPMETVTGGGAIAARAGAYGIPFEVVEGNDVWAVHEAAAGAVDRARAGDGPTLLECQTYRHFGHSKSDPAPLPARGRARPVEAARPGDARAGSGSRTRGSRRIDLAAVERRAEERIAEATEAALAADYPDPATRPGREFAGG